MSATASRLTVDDYYAITVEGDRKQLVDGRIVVNDEPAFSHSLLQTRVVEALLRWVADGQGHGLALLPTDVRLGEHDVYGPDVIWVGEDPPPLTDRDRLARVPDVWLVDGVGERVLVFRRSRPDAGFDVELELATGDELTSPQLPGFALPLARLFRR